MIRELFENCRQGAQALGLDADFSVEVWLRPKKASATVTNWQARPAAGMDRGLPGKPKPHHRHVSHLYSLYPGQTISLETTPDFAAAAKKTLELRGVGETGWSDVWRIALWARLRNPEQAYANLKVLLTTNTLPDMFDVCPPFQIDGNLGGPAAMTEMLIQSTASEITILPALPKRWQNGSLTGVRVRGGGKVNMEWKSGHLAKLKISADHPVKVSSVVWRSICLGQHPARPDYHAE